MKVLGKFGVIMSDPPWEIHQDLPYGTMADDEMRKMQVAELQDDGVMFLWVTGGPPCHQRWCHQRESPPPRLAAAPPQASWQHVAQSVCRRHTCMIVGLAPSCHPRGSPRPCRVRPGRAMELGRECLEIWGYKRVDELIWVKTNQLQRLIRTGRTGHWLNHSKEHCLVGIKGNPAINHNLDCDVLVAEVRAPA